MIPADRLAEHEVAIFLFHGVVEKSDYEVRNYTRKHLTHDLFRRVVEQLLAAGEPISLSQIVEHCRSGEPFPPRAFAVTFDDGFENNYSIAAPILSDYGVPASFFVTSGFIEHNSMSWIDRIEYFMEQTPRGALCLPWAEKAQRFDDRETKIALLEQVRFHAKRDPTIDLEALVSDIFSQGGLDEIECNDDPLDRKMSWDQVGELARHDLFAVGGHGHTHRIMSFLDDDDLETEISICLRLLEQKAGISTQHYSYPEGLAYCYTDRVIDVLRDRGIVCCSTAQEGTNRLNESLFELRRIAVV